MLTLHQAQSIKSKTKKRLGRGIGSGRGKTCGRGTKGQKARSKVRPGFEGGQMPLAQRIPKHKGFKNPLRVKTEVLNLFDLAEHFEAGALVNLESLKKKGLVKSQSRVKILGAGDLKKALQVEAHAFSKQAKSKIEQAKGKAIEIKQGSLKIKRPIEKVISKSRPGVKKPTVEIKPKLKKSAVSKSKT